MSHAPQPCDTLLSAEFAPGYEPRWHVRALVTGHLAVALLVITWIWPTTRQGWDWVDANMFYLLNGSLKLGSLWQTNWAISNLRVFDTFAGLIMLALLTHYIAAGRQRPIVDRIASAVFIGIYLAVVIVFTRELLFAGVGRLSPSQELVPFYDLRELVPWAEKAKVSSSTSFPGDHAVVTLTFTGMFGYFAGWRYGCVAVGLTFWFVLPRLIGGAHWFTDILVGSVSIATVALLWALATPLHHHARRWIGHAVVRLVPQRFGEAMARQSV